RNAFDSALKLRWLLTLARDPWIDFVNLRDPTKGTRQGAFTLGSYVNGQFDPTFDWHDLERLRSRWQGTLALKGVLTAEDARRATECGVNAVIVSNHGGRQLDGVPSALEALPEVVEAVRGQADVILDGGVRRGSDVVKAVALGARACMIGRSYLYGLGATGQAGAERAIQILQSEIARVLALLGRPRLTDLDRSCLRLPPDWLPG
ncbi:MAG TPA: alpha-hydroxy acid oxidase, partial [Dehalococcoidia bacterium]|nr:alpha-hydroxy acid oxidase [Dehalococcoidia bacterium]